MHVKNGFIYLLASNGYVINFASKGISGNALLYFTRHTSSDLKTQNICITSTTHMYNSFN